MPRDNSPGGGSLPDDLAAVVRGEVRFDDGARALYATDGSNYRQPPIGVVIPRETGDVVRAIEICRRYAVPVFGRGCGTSLAGQCCNAAVCFDFSKYLNRVLEIDPVRRIGRVQPGTILDDLRTAARRHQLTFGPDPATHSHCTLGGMVGNDSCGVHSVMAQFDGPGARTSDNIEELEILTYDGARMRVGRTSETELDAIIGAGGRRGEIYAALKKLRDRHVEAIRTGFPTIPRRVSGYNLTHLLPENGFDLAKALVGTESTCVMVLEIAATLIAEPHARTLLVLGYPDVYEAGDHIPEILQHRPIGLEGIDDRLIEDMKRAGLHTSDLRLLPEGKGWLLVEFGGDSREESDARARAVMNDLRRQTRPPSMSLVDDRTEELKIWEIRESGLGATAHSSSTPTWPGWEDSAVPPERVGDYLRSLRALLDSYGYACDLYGHFGQGCIHTRIDFDLQSAAGIQRYRQFVEDAADLVVRLGGSLSGEHGDGQARGELLPKMFPPQLMTAFREFKAIWDPAGRMNPGKSIDAAPLDAHLRLGAYHQPRSVATQFRYPNEQGSFGKATMRCVGVGKCRRLDGGTMCPSFMVTREEKHSTRGRARLLFEMLEGDPLTGGWQNEEVKDALDLCLACKGCKGDCPVKVDMATYKAEFLSHYYERHRRPASAYAFGLVRYWAALGSFLPHLVNSFARAPVLSALGKLTVGIPLERQIPALAPETFRRAFARRPKRRIPAGRRVLLWPDTFNNYFFPETAMAAARTLERAGYDVALPARPLCCGRPLYDYGMLDRARAWLLEILDALGPEIRAGTPIVVLEPSCASVFRDELRSMLPHGRRASALSRQVVTLGEFLDRERLRVPSLHRKALVHGHCHHRSVLDFDADRRVMASMGLEVRVLDSGCCGMAGAFGFEREHYAVSVAVGERVLLPAVRQAPRDTLIIADGFSCREQIAQRTERRALHLADVIEMAAAARVLGPAGDLPEAGYVPDYSADARPLAAASAAAGLMAAGVMWWTLSRRR